jgi:hypothetical protein
VFAAPWSIIVHDHVSLLRIVVCAAEVLAGALLYPLIVKTWRDPLAAVLAVVLVNLVTRMYGLVGNANLTNALGEAVALSTMVAASIAPGRNFWAAAGLFLLAALAFLSHVSTFAILAIALVTCASSTAGAAGHRCTELAGERRFRSLPASCFRRHSPL